MPMVSAKYAHDRSMDAVPVSEVAGKMMADLPSLTWRQA
jgi:hypothetical protein